MCLKGLKTNVKAEKIPEGSEKTFVFNCLKSTKLSTG